MSDVISILGLLAIIYQLYLQRVHNEKSLKPLVQIDLTDSAGLLYVHVQNNGVGPFIAERLIFFKDGQVFSTIKDCLTLSHEVYQYVPVNEPVTRVIPPGTYLEVFSKQFAKPAALETDDVRRQFAALRLKVEGRDIYNNKVSAERDLSWFIRHHN